MSNVLRNLPSVNELLESPPLKSLVSRVSHNVVVTGVGRFLDDLRGQVQGATGLNIPTPAELAERIAEWIATQEQPSLRPVINATGLLLHPGLGRGALADEALRAVTDAAAGYVSVEIDLPTGERAQRGDAVEKLLTRLTGAESAAVVNNNAAATLVALAALAAGREVIVARGQLIEVGGTYKLPEVVAASGATLREIGTTNQTRSTDYAAAIGERTAALMLVHASDYQIVGFAQQASLAELVVLGRRHNLPVIDNLGSGAIIDLAKYGVTGEPIVGERIQAGADLVLFSGDKLLGGPQCGILVGKRTLVQKILKHPLMRALQADKLTLAALAATLRLYRDPAVAERSIPLLSLLATSPENLKHRAERLAPQLAAAGVVVVEIVESQSPVGSGAVPSQPVATICLALAPVRGGVGALNAALRTGTPAVLGRLQDDRLLLDLRSVAPKYDAEIAVAVQALARRSAPPADSPQLVPVQNQP